MINDITGKRTRRCAFFHAKIQNETFFGFSCIIKVLIHNKQPIMSKTQDDLLAAFAGESQANRKYLAFAKKADEEGKKNLANLFRATAEGESIHALKHLNALGEVKNSAENLKGALAGETYEVENMYPGFIEDAKTEEQKVAEISFTGAYEVEKVHQGFYTEALAKIETGSDIEQTEYHVCSVCGNLFASAVPGVCPICKAPKEKFVLIT